MPVIAREMSALATVAALSMMFSSGPVLADNLDSAHSAFCMKLQQTAVLLQRDTRVDEGARRDFELQVEHICASPLSLFNGAPVDALGRQKASACYRSLALLSTDDVTAMDMPTTECGQFLSHIGG